ncbi:MAG: PorP/SprF family type IX secretion system membrane protein [Marinilabiliaceae bacterium]
MRKTSLHIALLSILFFCLPKETRGQQDHLMTHYMNNPLILNPAYAGNRNSIAIDVYSRQQWSGFDGAPSSYYGGIHAPVNNSMASIGGTLYSDHAGPVMNNRLSFDYAYMVRTSRRSFLSLGLRAGMSHLNIGLDKLDLIDSEDPAFQQGIHNEFRPSTGFGLVFLRPAWFFGASFPHLPFTEVPWASDMAEDYSHPGQYILSGGFYFHPTNELTVKMTGMHRIRETGPPVTDVGIQARYIERFRASANFRPARAASLVLGMQIHPTMGVSYAVEVPMDRLEGRAGFLNHEISLTFDFTEYIKPNRNRRFLKKRSREEDSEEEPMNSIRYF